ncbi:LuxR C-terminal-related transcriptional regulator [Microbacterium sp. SS28]|uniref:LuxR C-terminal-related transcriptional regulator n=1 Tax=Microbacterium sp. SS28 TaxID=2919948 RepID=UPI001FAB3139|nr:LuxR C-terminal-related transcriptional regulator [Microbacterium sp. SS28]
MVTQPWSASEAQLLAGALRDFAQHTSFPVVFGGFATEDGVRITTIHGSRTRSLEGLVVRRDRGLGGRAVTELRPRMTNDYGTSRQITHDYDGHVLGEGISALLAVPVVVDGGARGVLYGGSWVDGNVGDVVAAPGFRIAEALATELRIRDEVEKRVTSFGRVQAEAPAPAIDPAQLEELRESYAELRSISANVTDPALRERLGMLERRLAHLSGEPVADASEPESAIRLSPREIDVLACAALGATNAEIGRTLSLKEATVKSYLQAAMAKLDASTRHAAVAKARRLRLLP